MNKEWAELNRLMKRQDELYHRYAQNAGLTDTKFWVLYAMCESGDVFCQNAFCESWRYSKQTVSAAVASLEKDGLLYMEFVAGSKKQKNLQLTEKGKGFCREYIIPVMDAECSSIMKLEKGERRKFLDTMDKLLVLFGKEISTIPGIEK